MKMTLAVVLGGGGVAGIAWELGVVSGLADAGVSVHDAERFVGTSAGAVVAAALAEGEDGTDLAGRMRSAPAPRPPTGTADFGDADAWAELLAAPGSREGMLRRMGELAVRSGAGDQAAYVRSIGALLPPAVRRGRWPRRAELLVTTVDADTGRVRVWDRDGGAPPSEAVAASCAVPGLFPLVTVGGRRCFDGGMASPTHAHLAHGATEVLVVAPYTVAPTGPGLDGELEALGSSARTAVIEPDAASLAAIGLNPMDPSTRDPAEEAGRAQGRAEAMRIGIMLSL